MEVNVNDIDKFSKKHGAERTSRLLSALGKDRQFIDAWESPVGKEILGHLLNIIDQKLDKIINEESTDKDRAEYRVCMEHLLYFKKKINEYEKNLSTLKRG